MPDFDVLSPDREDIQWIPTLPERYQPLTLSGSHALMAQCSFGDMIFCQHQGEGFEIWKSIYRIDRDARVIGRANQATLELSFTLEHGPMVNLQGVYAGPLLREQIELYYAPWVDNCTHFQAGKTYQSLDIHFQPSILEPYAKDCPGLNRLLNAIPRKEASRLFGETVLASPRMAAVAREIMAYSYLDSLAPRYFDSYVHILLVLLLERISGLRSAPLLSPAHVELAQEAKRLLTVDYQASLSIAQLCRKLGTNPYLLKTAFKHVHGVSIGKYKKAAFMDYARQLLLDTALSLEDISILLGYNSQQSFNTAFRNHFGYTPGRVRRENGKIA